jgi:Fic family protein
VFTRKEAVLSTMIEGVRSTLPDLLLHELGQEPGAANEDLNIVGNYLAGLERGLRLVGEGKPVDLSLLKVVHSAMLAGFWDSNKLPGQFRRSQVLVGGHTPSEAAFVPPPADELGPCMEDFENFLADRPEHTSSLLKAALAHAQFESIHPFLDGNGRLGRILITLLLAERKVLDKPLLFLSLYFKTHRERYYKLLGEVSYHGEWEAWLDFFADAVIDTAGKAMVTAKALLELMNQDREKIAFLGRSSDSTLRIYTALLERPVVTYEAIALKTGITPKTVFSSFTNLMKLEIVTELTKRRRNRIFCYAPYMEILERGMEPPEPFETYRQSP